MIDAAEKARATDEIMEALGCSKQPAIEFVSVEDEPASEREALKRYNGAIDSLDQLIDVQDFERSVQYNATAMLLDGLKNERRLRFEPLIDWHRIAEGMGMKR